MASILRSGKFVRYFAGITRNLVFNTVRETEGSFVQNTQCACSCLSHGFATSAPKPDQNLEKSLKRLDQDVRRTGRISRRDIEEVLEEIRLQRSATSSQSLLVIRCCGNLVPEELPEVRTALVQEIWKTLLVLNVPMDISHYNALLRVYLENEHPFSPTDFLADLEAKGVEPNRVTYQRLIARYCQQGDIEGATRILEFMREKGLPVNENVFNALILGHSQANDLESAAGILSVMKQAGLEPSADTYTTLLCGYAHHGDLEAILRHLEECEKNEIYLLDKDLLDVVYTMTINGHEDKIDPILERMRKSAGYNQDAVNTILRLTNKGYEEIAFKILKTMPRAVKFDGELADTGTFFVRQLVKANRPTEKVIKICKQLQDESLNSTALMIAVEAGLTNGLTHSALPLLKEMKNSGMPIRQHYFWPLFCSVGSNQILDVLRKMQEEFGIIPSSETIRDYVIPNLKEKNVDKIVNLLRSAGVSLSTASTSASYYALVSNNLQDAANIATNYRAYYSPGLFRKPLIQALGKTNDFDSYIKFIRQVYDNLPRLANFNQSESSVVIDDDTSESVADIQTVNQPEILGQFVFDAVLYFKRNRVEMLEKLLSGLFEQGLSISNAQAERIQDHLGAEMTPQISELLGKLSAGDLEPIHIEKSSENARRNALQQMSVVELESMIKNLDAKSENTKGLKRQLIAACFREKNLEKSEEVISRLETEEYVISSGIYAQLIDLYCYHNKFDLAIQTFDKIKSKEPDFVLDNLKTVKLADLFAQNQQIDQAIKFLELNKKDDLNMKREERNFNYKTTCWRILNSIAETGNATDLQRIFDALLANNYIEISNAFLGPLVKVHLINNDLKKAVDTFEEICNKHQSTPWKNELACRLIQSEDAINLQRLTDLSTNIHGEVNSLYDLVFSFVECGRIRQARKILETPGLRNRPQRINSACERYRQEGMVQSLEGLAEATKDLNHIDRSDIYYNLLLSYYKDDQPEKALGLWTKMQEEDITPSDEFLLKLAEFLKEKNLEIPFVVPNLISQKEMNESNIKKSTQIKGNQNHERTKINKDIKPKPQITNSMKEFKINLRNNNIDEAIAIRNQLSADEKLGVVDQSLLIEALCKASRLQEATKYTFDMFEQNMTPLPRIFKFYLNRLAASGDVETIERIGDQISPDMKKQISYDNRLCNANISAGKSEQYINKLLEEIEHETNPETIIKLSEKFPRGGALGILEKQPELAEKFEQIAKKYAEHGILAPMNVLWINNVINNNEENAKRIWENYLTSTPRLMFQRILQAAREKQDEKLAQRLIAQLKIAKISVGALGNAYSCLLDVLTTKEKFDDGLKMVKSAMEDVCLENFNRTALMRLKSGIEKQGKTFPYTIPDKSSKIDSSSSSSSSSSDSDEDVIPTRPETIKLK